MDNLRLAPDGSNQMNMQLVSARVAGELRRPDLSPFVSQRRLSWGAGS